MKKLVSILLCVVLTLCPLLISVTAEETADGNVGYAFSFPYNNGIKWDSTIEQAKTAEGVPNARTDTIDGITQIVIDDVVFAGRQAARYYMFEQNGPMVLATCECIVDPTLAGDCEAAFANVKAELTQAYGEPNMTQLDPLFAFYESMGETPDRTRFEAALWSGWIQPDGTLVFASYIDKNVGVMFIRHQKPKAKQLAAGVGHIALLLKSGKAVAFGENGDGETDVTDWSDILQLSCGGYQTYGLKADGTVLATGYLTADQRYDVDTWTDIAQIAGGDFHTVGLKKDGKVVATGNDTNGQCDVSDWTNIVQIACGESHTVGLRDDGTVVAVGKNYEHQCEVSGWTDIVQIAASRSHTVGLRADGTVVAAGGSDHGKCSVEEWKDIAFVACSSNHTFGLRVDGTVVETGLTDDGLEVAVDWAGVERLMTADRYVFALQNDGTALVASSNEEADQDEFDPHLIEAVKAYLE